MSTNKLVTLVDEMTSSIIKGFEQVNFYTIRIILDNGDYIYFIKSDYDHIMEASFVKSQIVMVNNE